VNIHFGQSISVAFTGSVNYPQAVGTAAFLGGGFLVRFPNDAVHPQLWWRGKAPEIKRSPGTPSQGYSIIYCALGSKPNANFRGSLQFPFSHRFSAMGDFTASNIV